MINFFKRIARNCYPSQEHPIRRAPFHALQPIPLLEEQLQKLEYYLQQEKEDLQHAVEMREEWNEAVNERLEITQELEKQIQLIKDFIK